MQRLRRLLVATVLAAGLAPAWAQSRGPSVDVVKIMSFSCNVCYAAEAQDRAIAAAVKAKGGRFVWAPLPTQEEDTGAREQVYYAARDIDPGMADSIKSSIYKGTQDQGVQLFDFMQVYTWLSQDLPAYAPKFDQLFQKAQGQAGRQALGRAVRLANNVDAKALPTYVILVNGRIDTALDPSTAKSGNLMSLREDVLARIEALTSRK